MCFSPETVSRILTLRFLHSVTRRAPQHPIPPSGDLCYPVIMQCGQSGYRIGVREGIDLITTGCFAVQVKIRESYVPVATIDEIHGGNRIPIVITRADSKPAMAIIPSDSLKGLFHKVFT